MNIMIESCLHVNVYFKKLKRRKRAN